jgi:hypothetical protein
MLLTKHPGFSVWAGFHYSNILHTLFINYFKLNENSAGILLMHYQSDLKASELYADFVPSRPFRLIHVNVQIRTQNFFRKKTTSRLLHVDRIPSRNP